MAIKITAANMVLAEFARETFVVVPPLGMTARDLLDPSVWMPVAARLKPGARIDVMAQDGAYFAEFLVTATGHNWVSVALLRETDLNTVVKLQAEVDDFDIVYAGPIKKFQVLRGKDMLKEGFQRRPDAQVWLDEHRRTVYKAA